jgi:uncharacterized protein (TIGR03086 family)
MRPAPLEAPPLVESLALLERAVAYARGALMHVTPTQLRRPTPCSAWDLGQLLAHMDDSLAALTEAADLGEVRLRVPDGPASPVAVVESLRVRACSLLGAWSRAAGGAVLVGDRTVASSIVACAGALEITVHGWDVGRATGHGTPVPDALALDLLGWVPVFVADADRPHRFGPELAVPMGTASDRLLALVGRHH